MKRLIFITLIAFIALGLSAGSVGAYEISDADGDGVNEPGEIITLIGDDGYTDENGVEHPYTGWHWDFDGDYVFEESGQIVTHIFPEEGSYMVTLMYVNSGITIEEITIEVNTEEPEPPYCYKFKKIKNIIKWLDNDNIPDEVKIKLILKHMEKRFDIDLDTDDLDEIRDFIEDFIEDYKEHCKNKRGHRNNRGRGRCK